MTSCIDTALAPKLQMTTQLRRAKYRNPNAADMRPGAGCGDVVLWFCIDSAVLSMLRQFSRSSCTAPVAKMLAISSKACSAGEEKLEPCSFFTLEQRMKSEDVNDVQCPRRQTFPSTSVVSETFPSLIPAPIISADPPSSSAVPALWPCQVDTVDTVDQATGRWLIATDGYCCRLWEVRRSQAATSKAETETI